jgi:hypothetical protein
VNSLARCGGALLVLTALAATPLRAAEPQKADVPAALPRTSDAELAGHYFLNGIMETGSELLLRPDGRFQWYFTYGALDLDAEGRWQREGDHVVLLPEIFHFPPQYPETEFKRMQLRIDGNELIPAWPWEDGAERGRYAR